MCRSCWSATSSAAASSRSWSARTRCCRQASARRLAGYIVNKFRGDVSLFDGGIAAIGERTGLALLRRRAVFRRGRAAAGRGFDGAAAILRSDRSLSPASGGRAAVPGGQDRRAAAAAHRQFRRSRPAARRAGRRAGAWSGRAQPLPRDAALVILPGSKATLADLAFLRREGWDIDILAHRRHGGHVLGLCGGYQMLGRRIADPRGPRRAAGRGGRARACSTSRRCSAATSGCREPTGTDLATGMPVRGYEMHLGATTGPGLARPMLDLGGRPDGAVSADGRVAGCYLHGLFAGDAFRRAFLARLGAEAGDGIAYERDDRDDARRARRSLERHLDLAALLAAARAPRLTRAA